MARQGKEGVFLYGNIIEIVRSSSDADAKQLVISIADYVMQNIEPVFQESTPLALVWLAIKPNLDIMRMRREVGKMGGAPIGNTNSQRQPKDNQNQPTDNQVTTYKDKDRDKDKEERKRFIKPSEDDLALYVRENDLRYTIPQDFINYYESNGWKVGRNPMKDWKAAVRNWNSRQKQKQNPHVNHPSESQTSIRVL